MDHNLSPDHNLGIESRYLKQSKSVLHFGCTIIFYNTDPEPKSGQNKSEQQSGFRIYIQSKMNLDYNLDLQYRLKKPIYLEQPESESQS